MRLYKYNLEELKEAIRTSTSIRQVLMKLDVAPKGGNYRVFHRSVEYFDLDTSHFTGMQWSKGKTLGTKRDLVTYLSNEFSITSHKLRLRLLEEEVFPHQCNECKRDLWLEQPIPLELEHVDGNHTNNNLENLRLLCPNCHAQTPTYRGRNRNNS
ncbi:hypothetical protein LCGC14_0693330 [marine sediment metagenome]|uniref:HNH nuclease domain-containing protein n=1 Tax=marine sediment metagenome TaxID=412755 RepID=A0A0F9QPR5_9ZZZZ